MFVNKIQSTYTVRLYLIFYLSGQIHILSQNANSFINIMQHRFPPFLFGRIKIVESKKKINFCDCSQKEVFQYEFEN